MRLENIEGAIFDLDETLIDAQKGLNAAHESLSIILQKHLEKKGIRPDRQALKERIGKFDDKMNKELRYNRDQWWQELVREISSSVTLPKAFVEELTMQYWQTYEEAATPYPDAADTLLYLAERNYALALVSDTDGKLGLKAQRIRRLPFFELFDVCIAAGDETTELKATGIPFLLAADRICVPPKKCVVVGDKPFADIVGGKRAGMTTVLIARRQWDSTVEPDYEFTTLSELRTLL